MDIKTLHMYLHLAKSLHFSKTAQAMHVSPSTLSRAMQRLESEVGVKLLQRDNRSVALTYAGIEYRHFAKQTLDNWITLKNKIDPSQALLKGKLTIYCSVTAAYSHLPELLDRFRDEQPLIEIILSTGDPDNAVNEVKTNHADIAIAALPDNFPNNLHFSKIDNISLHVIAPTIKGQVQDLLRLDPIPWEKVPFIIPEHGPGRDRCLRWFKQQGITPNIYAQVSGQEAIASMVALGCGVSITPDVVLNNSPIRDRIQIVESAIPIVPFELGCCCKKNRLEDPILNAFFKKIYSK
ncbi:DNA-binding transcriptional regulator IlvY [Psychromonas sp. CNPT3]|uniref:HTH-type transcriptional activator IlvY n=1 Tax=Psychromonas sp. CNPT3 TaxID=314282 RepID=UPI00006E70C7|nr:HTH-type transcriptional activator IlvY [Psychromonas sp. CNPT3]AGH81471.1 DNA-binding transcriptional regulator IlvY [Psychromonas sp. CNPT3]